MEETFRLKDYLGAIRISGLDSVLDDAHVLEACAPCQTCNEDGTRVIKTACRACIAN